MKTKKIIAIVIACVGIGAIGFSLYIRNEVASGRAQVRSAERSVDKANSLFSLSPATKDIGTSIKRSADKKISAANSEIAYYSNLATGLLIVGIICIAGSAIWYIRFKKQGR